MSQMYGSLAAVGSSYFLLQVTRIYIRYYKSRALRLNEVCVIKSLSLLLPLTLLLVLHTLKNADGNKLVIFSGIAL